MISGHISVVMLNGVVSYTSYCERLVISFFGSAKTLLCFVLYFTVLINEITYLFSRDYRLMIVIMLECIYVIVPSIEHDEVRCIMCVLASIERVDVTITTINTQESPVQTQQSPVAHTTIACSTHNNRL